ncbi:hypothetical protein [Actinopolymorpha pittospori]
MLYAFLAAAAPRDQSVWVGPGLLGFVVIAGIGVATVLLWRNMNKQLRKAKASFEEQEPGQSGGEEGPDDGDPDGSTGDSAGGASERPGAGAGSRRPTS